MEYADFDYELIDSGYNRRIERFGEFVLDRPCPQALWSKNILDTKTDGVYLRNERKKGWEFTQELPETWNIKVGPNTAKLKFSNNSQVGIFPEQWDNWQWIDRKVSENKDRELNILNTFSYTGMSSLFASQDHTTVCHVDGAKSAVNWAKQNAELSGKSENKIRWICDDVRKFMTRELKRGNKYDGIILDPPAFGRGDKQDWKIERDLPELMELVGNLLTDKPLFVILTCHAPEHFSAKDLGQILEGLPRFEGKNAELLDLEIPSLGGNTLPSSFGARISS